MIIIDYKKKHHKQIIQACVNSLKKGKSVVYPTDTCYGLAVDATNIFAIRKLYKIKGRNFNKPVHVVVPSVGYAKKIVEWPTAAQKLAKKFWPGALTLVLGIKYKVLGIKPIEALTAGTGYLGVRMPDNKIALDLSRLLKHPITATSGNRSGEPDCYSASDVIAQFSAKGGSASGGKPDIIIDAGKLPKRKPSTVVKIDNNKITILRPGPIKLSKVLFAKLGKEHL